MLALLMQKPAEQLQTHTVNVVIGDVSFVETFGRLPDENTDEHLRIQTHLAFVETLMSRKNVDLLNQSQQVNRQRIIQLLHDYRLAGQFPVNEAFPERRPCFIDRYGNICAVGYLVEKTLGRQVAEQINSEHQYDYIADMNEEILINWAEERGLTLEECAMIQPGYVPAPRDQDAVEQSLKTGYGITSGILGGINVAFTISNTRISSKAGSKRLALIGIVAGAAQVAYGVIKVRRDGYLYKTNELPTRISYKANNNLSYINIAAGTATLITSTINFTINRKLRSGKNCVQLYSYPGVNDKLNIGLVLARHI
jgi:hypothetical protein